MSFNSTWHGPGYAPGEAQCFVFSCREGTAAGSKVKVLMWLGGLAAIPHRKGHSLAYWLQKNDVSFSVSNKPMNGIFFHISLFCICKSSFFWKLFVTATLVFFANVMMQ